MFLQVFSKKVCFCCILGYFAEKKLPQISQILTDGACLEFCELCVLWETLLYKKVLCRSVKSVGENHSKKVLCRSVKSVGENRSKKVRVKSVGELFWLRGVYPPTEQTGRGCSPTARRFCEFCEICGRKSQQEGCVGMAGMPYPPKVSPFQ